MPKSLGNPVVTNPRPVTSFQRAVLNQRARLIVQEARVHRIVEQGIQSIGDDWVKEIRQILRSQHIDPKNLSSVKRKAEILARTNKITTQQIRSLQKIIGTQARSTFTREALRTSQVMSQHLGDKATQIGVSFSGINRGAMQAAMVQSLPATQLSKSLTKAASAIGGQLNKDVTRAIADGWTLDRLARRWASQLPASATARAINELSTVARTAMMTAADNAAVHAYTQDSQLVEMLQWEATFDSRTCMVCAILHGQKFAVGNIPAMPAHPNCRCTWLPVFIDPSLEKAFTHKKVYQRPDGRIEHRRMDRQFDTWLRKQDIGVQRDFFGSELKFRAFRTNRIDMASLARADGSLITDRQLAARLGDDAKFVKKYRPDLGRELELGSLQRPSPTSKLRSTKPAMQQLSDN